MTHFLLLLILVLTSCAGQKTYYADITELSSIHLVDRDGMTEAISNSERLKNFETVNFLSHQPYQKVLRVFERDSNGNIGACITTYHDNGQLRQYLEILNNRAFGSYKEWYPNGILKIDGQIVEGSADIHPGAEKSWLFDGTTQAYDDSGNLEASINYARGSLEGISTYYHPNGTIWKKIPYQNNKITGDLSVYLNTGELFQTVHYENGIRSGTALRYWPGQTTSSEENYVQGKLIAGTYCLPDGSLVSEIKNGEGYRSIFSKDALSELHEYHGGVPLGEVKIFNTSGNISKIYHTKNGVKHGEELFYFPSAKPKLSISWYEGKIQGLVKTWYESGGMESQKEMSENTRNGVSTAWYRDGQLMMIEEYENNILKKGDYYRKGSKLPLTQIVQGEGTATFFDPEGNYLRKIPYLNGKPDK